MTYLKCRWDETRGDPYVEWGCSWWYFEFQPDGYVARHVEVYDNGVRLRYSRDHLVDEHGKLAEGRREDWTMPDARPMTAEEFEAVWREATPSGAGP